MLSLRSDSSIPYISCQGSPVAALTSHSAQMTALYHHREPILLKAVQTGSASGEVNDIFYEAAGWTVHDVIETTASGLIRCLRTWKNCSPNTQNVALVFEVFRLKPIDFYLIPAVSYNGNPWGGGSEPKGLVDSDFHASPAWVFGGDRSSIPACTITASAGCVLALFVSPGMAAQSACALIPAADREGAVGQQVYWPIQELPRSYVKCNGYNPGIENEVELVGGASCSREVFIAVDQAPDIPQGVANVLARVWRQLMHSVPACHSPQELWRLGIRYARESLWQDSAEFVGFVLGRILHNGQWVIPEWILSEIGWCGQNSTIAVMFLQDYLWHRNEDSWRKGEAALEWWRKHCLLPTGLFLTHIGRVSRPDETIRLEICNLGGGSYAFLLASQLAEQAGRPRPLWRKMGLDCCDFFVHHMLPDGRFGRYWSPQGRLLDADGTVGSWMIWPLLKAYRLTGSSKYLQAARRGFAYYADNDLANFLITAGALDTDCIDKEGAFPLLMAGLDLYEITGDREYLLQAEKAAVYLATWQWHYTLSYPPGTAAAQIGYETFGGTSVSVQHHHLDPWGVLIALGWLRLGRHTGKVEWTERAVAAWRQGTYGVSNGSLTIDGITRPAGGQDEGFLHTRWGKSVGSVSDWCVAWPTAFRLFVLTQWDNWQILE